MSELKKCEHCGGAVTLEVIDGRACIDDPTCERRHWEADVLCRYQGVDGLVEWWNTRVERTCHPVEPLPPSESLSTPVRLSCGHVVEGILDGEASMLPNFCEVCGAKVVEP